MYQFASAQVYQQSRWKGQVVSTLVHGLLLLGALLPFLHVEPPLEAGKEALVIQFDYPYNEYVKPEKFVDPTTGETSKMSGSEAGGSPVSEEAARSRPQMAAPSPLGGASAVSAVSPMSSGLRTDIGAIPMPAPSIARREAWASVQDFGGFEVDDVGEMQLIDWSDGAFGDVPGSGTGDGDDDSDIWSDGFGSGTGGTGGSGGGPGGGVGKGSGPGGGTGTGGAGNKTGIGQNGNGLQWGVGLDGQLDRKLRQRADIGQLAVKPGKVVFEICVDRNGKVIYHKYDLANSTIKDADFVNKAEALAASYVFYPNIAAPERECGKLILVFKIK